MPPITSGYRAVVHVVAEVGNDERDGRQLREALRHGGQRLIGLGGCVTDSVHGLCSACPTAAPRGRDSVAEARLVLVLSRATGQKVRAADGRVVGNLRDLTARLGVEHPTVYRAGHRLPLGAHMPGQPTIALMLASHSDHQPLVQRWWSGSRGCLLKQVAGIDLVGAVRTITASGCSSTGGVTLDLGRLGRSAGPKECSSLPHESAGTARRRTHRRRSIQPEDQCVGCGTGLFDVTVVRWHASAGVG